jgi:hypothetical protein
MLEPTGYMMGLGRFQIGFDKQIVNFSISAVWLASESINFDLKRAYVTHPPLI